MSKHSIDLLALSVAFTALLISAYSIWQTDKSLNFANEANKIAQESLNSVLDHNEKSLRPILAFRYQLSIGARQGGYFSVRNSGEGTAIITAIRATFDGDSIGTDAATLSRLGNPYGMTGYNLVIGESISKDETITVFDIPPRSLPQSRVCEEDRARKQFFERLRISIDYTSIYGYSQTLDNYGYRSSNTLRC